MGRVVRLGGGGGSVNDMGWCVRGGVTKRASKMDWTYCFAWFLSWAEMGLAMVCARGMSEGKGGYACWTHANGESGKFDSSHRGRKLKG